MGEHCLIDEKEGEVTVVTYETLLQGYIAGRGHLGPYPQGDLLFDVRGNLKVPCAKGSASSNKTMI